MIIALISALGVMILILGLFGLLILLDRRMEKREKSVLTDTTTSDEVKNGGNKPDKEDTTTSTRTTQGTGTAIQHNKALPLLLVILAVVATSVVGLIVVNRPIDLIATPPPPTSPAVLKTVLNWTISALLIFLGIITVIFSTFISIYGKKISNLTVRRWGSFLTVLGSVLFLTGSGIIVWSLFGSTWQDLSPDMQRILWWITTAIVALVIFFGFWRLSKLFKKRVESEDGARRAGVFENTCRRVLKYDVGSTTLFRFFATGLVTFVIMIGVHFLAQIYWPESWSGWRRSGVELFWIPNLGILLFFPLIITFRRWGWLPALAIVGITVLGVLSSLDWLSSTTSTGGGRHRSTATQPSQPREWVSVGELRGKQSVTPLRNLFHDEYQLSYDIWYPDSRGKRGSAVLKRCIEDGNKYYGTFEYQNPKGEGEVWLEEIPDRPGHFRGQSWSDYTNGEKVWFEIRPK